MSVSGKRREFQGFVLAIELTGRHLSFKAFRLIPLARIKLTNVLSLRIAAADDYVAPGFLFRNRFWPTPAVARRRDTSTYVLRTRRGTQVFFRLTHRMHYLLRGAVADHVHAARRQAAEVAAEAL